MIVNRYHIHVQHFFSKLAIRHLIYQQHNENVMENTIAYDFISQWNYLFASIKYMYKYILIVLI